MSSICRVNKSHNFTVMSNYHLRDSHLSLKAVGLLSKVLALPDEWKFSIEGLASIVKEGKSAVAATLNELEKEGYLKRNKIRDAYGRIICVEYIFYEIPQNRSFDDMDELKDIRIDNEDDLTDFVEIKAAEKKDEGKNSNNLKTDLPFLDNPETASPLLDNPDTDNRALLNTNNIKYLDIYHSEPEEHFEAELKEQTEYNRLILSNPEDKGLIDDCISVMSSALSGRRDVRIGKKKIPYRKMRDKFAKIRKEHMHYIVDSVNRYAGDIRNVKSYLLTVCYNVPDKINPYMLRERSCNQFNKINQRSYDFDLLEKQLLYQNSLR